jgi:hypothetical protein
MAHLSRLLIAATAASLAITPAMAKEKPGKGQPPSAPSPQQDTGKDKSKDKDKDKVQETPQQGGETQTKGGKNNGADTGSAGKVTLLTTPCDLVAGCLFSGNDQDAGAVELAYEAVYPLKDLSLTLLTKIEFNGPEQYAGQWQVSSKATHYSVKSSNSFMLYQLSQPAMSGQWSTSGLVNKNGGQQAVSHLSVWTSSITEPVITAVPEPTTWAMMILGFVAIGAVLRSRRSALASA